VLPHYATDRVARDTVASVVLDSLANKGSTVSKLEAKRRANGVASSYAYAKNSLPLPICVIVTRLVDNPSI
jgi:hypothetical protein